ncbi:hypothetical protein KKKH17_06530 [Helicobacter pylori]
MWNEKILKIIPALLFLFCILEIFEMALIIDDMNKIEKLEEQLKQNLEVLEKISNSLGKGMACLQHHRK